MLTEKQAIERWLSGDIVVRGEYRMSKTEMLNWRDKQTGRPMSAPMLRHTVEIGSASVQLSERVPDNTKLEDIKIPFKKGDCVLVVLEEYITTKGLASARGRLETINGDPKPLEPSKVGSARSGV